MTEQPPVKKEVELRARPINRLVLSWAISITVLFALFFLMDWFHFNPLLVVIAGILFLIYAFFILREKPIPDMWSTWDVIKRREYKMSYTTLPQKPERMQAEPHGQYWIFQARYENNNIPGIATYFWQEVPGRVVGRRMRYLDDIKREMDKSKISTAVATQALMRYEKNKILETAGFEPEDEATP